MRVLTALTLNVSLAAMCFAAEWKTVHAEGSAAVDHRRLADAERLLRASLDFAQTQFQTAMSASDLGVTLHRMGRDREAAPELERALRIWTAIRLEGDRYIRTAGSLAAVKRSLGDYRTSEQLMRQALATHGASPELEGWMRNSLADLLREQGRTGEALSETERVVAMPGISRAVLSDALVERADLERDAGDFSGSAADARRVIEIARERHDTITEAVALRALSQTLLDKGETSSAAPLLKKSLDLFEHTPDTTPYQLAATRTSIAQLYLGEGKLSLAEESERKAIGLVAQSLGEAHPQVGVLDEFLADILGREGHFDDARGYMDRANEIMVASFGEGSAAQAAVFANRATLELRARNKKAAKSWNARALAILQSGGADVDGLRRTVKVRAKAFR